MRYQTQAIVALLLLLLAGPVVLATDDVVVASPNGSVQFKLLMDQSRMRFAVMLKDTTVIEPSPIIMTIDGGDITTGVQAHQPERYTRNETFPSRLIHSKAVDHCNGVKVPLKHGELSYTLEIRAYDDAVAFRTIVPGRDDAKRIPDEQTTFIVPAGSTVWHHGLSGHYEGEYTKNDVAALANEEWVAPPMTFELPNHGGYGSITEAALVNYSGMALDCDGQRGFALGLGHRQPVSHPYAMRYSKEDVAHIQQPAAIDGTITTPWRVVLIGADLNTLVNSDVIQACCAPPDPKLFPEGVNTDWCKAGRAVWRYTDGGENSLAGLRSFSKLASQLGFEYQVCEGLWRRWDDEELRNFVSESKQEGVGLLVWEHSKNLRDPKVRHEFLQHLHDFGIDGAKIDFFDNEQKDTVDLYQSLLREGAELHLVMDFHGANKPTGESRTWPNELSREAIRGMEASRLTQRAFHETTLPFTRFLAGHAEYTVVNFGSKRADTSVAHQIASAAILSSELLTYSLNPEKALASPARDMIQSVPATWDETAVLPPSEISQMALYARRKGDTWFLACMNGPAARSVDVPLTFLGNGDYHATMAHDGVDPAPPTTQPFGVSALVVENSTMKRDAHIKLDLAPGGGFIARFNK